MLFEALGFLFGIAGIGAAFLLRRETSMATAARWWRASMASAAGASAPELP